MSETNPSRRPPLLWLLAAIILLECVFLAVVTVYLIVELIVSKPDSYASALAILVLAGLAAIWLGVMSVHTLQGRSWIRAGAVVWQFLQIAVGIGSFQGAFARPDVGWLLIIPAVIVLVLLFTPSVVAATKRRERE